MSKFIRLAILAVPIAAAPGLQAQTAAAPKEKAGTEEVIMLEKFVAVDDSDPKGLLPADSDLFGTSKPIVETARSVSVVGSEMIDKYSITELADLASFAPSTYTAFSFGIQGSVNVRGDSADAYFRGMKRINNGSNMPTVIGASDGVAVVRGPAAATSGNGAVGGYVDYLPKTARATTGRYLERMTGKITTTFGSYGKKVLSLEAGGPTTLLGKRAGYYAFGQMEDSDSYYIGSFTRQQVVQATLTVDLSDALRLETGVNYQNFHGTGLAGWNRVTQDLIDHRVYITGVPKANLDTNGNGMLSRSEILAAGDLNKTIAVGTHPALPIGYALDPATMGTATLSPRQVLVERDGFARDYIVFVDLINDKNRSLILTNKLFAERQSHHKLSEIAYFRAHEAFVAEEKFTVVWTPTRLPEWMKGSVVGALNARYLSTYNTGTSGEQIFSRWDLTRYTDGYYGITDGWDSAADAGLETATKANHSEAGMGVSIDMTFFRKLNIAVAERNDTIDGKVYTKATNIAPTAAAFQRGSDHKTALASASVTYELFPNVFPYVTYAKPRTLVPGSSGGLSAATLRGREILQPSELKEAGLKANLLNKKLFFGASVFSQFRSTYNATLDEYVSTLTDGTDVEIRWVPNRHFNISAAADWKRAITDPPSATSSQVTPQFLGYTPQEAYGGRLTQTIPAEANKRRFSPDKVFSLFGNYAFGNGWDVSLGGNYRAAFPAAVTQDIRLPAALTFSASIGYVAKTWDVRLSGKNLTDELYFQSNSFGSTLALPATGRTWDVRIARRY